MSEPYHHGNLRNALINAGVQAIESKGTEVFSLREAARTVGVSANAAYRHFADKPALLTAVAACGFEDLSQRMLSAIATVPKNGKPSAKKKLKAMAAAYVDLAVERTEMFRLMFGANGLCRIIDAWPSANPPLPGAILDVVLDELVTEGCLSLAARPNALLKIWAVVHGFASLALDGVPALQQPKQRALQLNAILDFALIGLCDLDRRW